VFRNRPWALVWLWVACGGLAAFLHHVHRTEFPPTDVARFARPEPIILKVRGTLTDDPFTRHTHTADPLVPVHRTEVDVSVLDLSEVETTSGWQPCSGRIRLWVNRDDPRAPPMNGLRSGDTVQAVGRFHVPEPPGSPGERDLRNDYLDRGWRGDLRVNDTSAVVRLEAGGWDANRVLAWVRSRSSAALDSTLGASEAPVGKALLLGDTNALDRTEWDSYARTGVVHVLAISGQHLVLLAGFAWLVLHAVGVSRSRAAWVVAAVVFGYALLTGLRPSALRAAVMVAAICGAIVLRRPVNTANSFALAWLAVIGVNPSDAFDLGCRLSFISVFVLVWGVGRWVTPRKRTPLERLIDESRSWWEKALRATGRAILVAFFVNAVLFLANTPLLVTEQNLVSPVGLLVGPPLVLLTSIALVCGFLLLLLAGVPLLSDVLAACTRWSLAAAEWCVHRADGLPLGSMYVPSLPGWWLVGFYALVAVIVLRGWRASRWFLLAMVAWIALAALWPTTTDRPPDELRTTFLSVGHGGCIVLEMPDGRCFLYDCGTTAGPDVVRRVIAPYLWSRGIRDVDELFVSHADADHFNGIGELVRRFRVGRVTFTPSFAEKPAADVAEVVAILKRAEVPIRVVSAGQRFEAGDVSFEVLHPPAVGPPGVENERSMVLVVRHAGHSILLTGDLEKAGTDRVLSLAPTPADVLMAPHHGSKAAFPSGLRTWAAPKCVLVSRGNLYANTVTERETGVPTWDTFTHGTLTVRSNPTGVTVEGYKTGLREVVRGK